MGTTGKVRVIVWAVLAVLTACEDGGPPSPFSRPGTRDAPNTAADGGSREPTDLSIDDAGPTPQRDGEPNDLNEDDR